MRISVKSLRVARLYQFLPVVDIFLVLKEYAASLRANRSLLKLLAQDVVHPSPFHDEASKEHPAAILRQFHVEGERPIQAHLGSTMSNCIICNSRTSFYFSKEYASYPGSPFEKGLSVDYWKCEGCGFVLSETHANMSYENWSQLNSSWHHYYENHARITNPPPYPEQALAIAVLAENKIIDLSQALDYAAGYGSLANTLKKYFGFEINIFDRHVKDKNQELKYLEENELTKHGLVINSAMFEHVLNKKDLDDINSSVSDDGVLMLHSVICEKIPSDPNWFYLTPMVHTAFHTNASMNVLMKQWGYAASIYCPTAKSWFLFKKDFAGLEMLEQKVIEINNEFKRPYLHYKIGFLDYWKGF